MNHKLSQSTIEKLGYYVYILSDPRTGLPFYVGKGKGNRINQHLLGALKNKKSEVDKINRIHEIQNEGLEVWHEVMRYGLTENEAFEVESALIDYIGLDSLTNIVKGHHTYDKGRANLKEIRLKYQAKEAIFNESVLLISINNTFQLGMSPSEIYRVSQGHWKIDLNRANKIDVVCVHAQGIIREVYTDTNWFISNIDPNKKMFEGTVAKDSVRNKYIDKSIKSYWKQGQQNSVRYIDR